jgi:uncharacterized protein YjiS (DUF1127 family)
MPGSTTSGRSVFFVGRYAYSTPAHTLAPTLGVHLSANADGPMPGLAGDPRKKLAKQMEMIMGMISTAPVAAHGIPGRSWGKELGAILAHWWVAHIARRMEQRALAALARMSDRELKDIGLTRSDIPAAVRGQIIRDRAIIRSF